MIPKSSRVIRKCFGLGTSTSPSAQSCWGVLSIFLGRSEDRALALDLYALTQLGVSDGSTRTGLLEVPVLAE